jgi:hypothetical protein
MAQRLAKFSVVAGDTGFQIAQKLGAVHPLMRPTVF